MRDVDPGDVRGPVTHRHTADPRRIHETAIKAESIDFDLSGVGIRPEVVVYKDSLGRAFAQVTVAEYTLGDPGPDDEPIRRRLAFKMSAHDAELFGRTIAEQVVEQRFELREEPQ